jgi:outer membrane protein assembly factor BamE (lipoprotein component of BamABCDE complex)
VALAHLRDRLRAGHRLIRAATVAALVLLAACATELGSLTPEQANTVRVGQSRDEVRAALGAPASTSTARRGQQEVWTYRLYDRGQVQRHQLLFVHFGSDAGDVVRIERVSDPAFGGDMSRTVPRRSIE